MTKSTKSVFNKPMREVKKPAKKIPVKKKEPSPVDVTILDPVQDMRDKASFAIDFLREVVSSFKSTTGEQDVQRGTINLFLKDLEVGIKWVSEILGK